MLRTNLPKAVLFLHAFPLNKDMFRFQFCALEREGIPYVAVDYPGFGESPPLAGEYTLGRLTDWVVSKLSELRVKKVVAVGDSMGGYIMFDLFERYPELVEGLVFVATRAQADSPEAREARLLLSKRVKEEGKDFLVDMMLENQTSPATKRDEKKMRLLWCMMQKATREGISKTLIALANRPDFTELLPKINVPALVVAGRDDQKVTPPEVVRQIAEGIPGARYYELENSAHLPPFENPDAFNEILLSFLKEFF